MSPIEEKVTELLGELATAAPVEIGTPPTASTVAEQAARARRPDYVPIEAPVERARRRPVLVAAAVVLVVVVVGGLLVLGRVGRSPVVASLSDLPVDTSLLGDGRMAVVVENQLYIADGPTGQVWKLTDTGQGEEVSNVSFSHDGEWVAFTIHDESGLWVSRWDGAERHRIGRAPSTYAWSPTDDQLAYATQDQVRVAQTDGSSRALRVAAAPKAFTRVVWSPAGTGVAFVQVGGGTTREALDDTAEPEWSSTYTVPASEVVAWPSAEKLVVLAPSAQLGTDQMELASMVSLSTEVLSTIPGDVAVTVAPSGSQLAVEPVGSRELLRCDLLDVGCFGFTLADVYRSAGPPAFSPEEASVAVWGPDLAGYDVLTATNKGAAANGVRLGDQPRSVSGVGYELEGPVWIDESALLVRVDEDRVERIDLASPSVGRTTVVSGDRFLPPADDYPGGTGLAFWSPGAG